VLTKRQRKQRGLQRRSALSAKNITEYAMSESAKIQQRNRNMKTDVLKTSPERLQTVVCIAPPTKNEAEHG
jgi:hypothetical protein